MKHQKLLSIIALLLLLASCSPAATALPAATASQTAEPTSTFTPGPTETPTSTPTETPIAVDSLSGQLLFDMYHTGKVEYSQLNDIKRKELAVLNGENIRFALTSKTITSTGTWDDGSFDIGLTNSLQWARTDSLPASEFANASEHVAPVLADCFLDDNNDLVEIGPNGEEYVVPRFNVDGPLAGMSIVDVAQMSQTERKAIAAEMITMIAEAKGAAPERVAVVIEYINSEDYDLWPIFIDPFYTTNNLFVHWSASTAEAGRVDVVPTHVVSTVILNENNAPIACIRIHEAPNVNQNVYDISAGETPDGYSAVFLQPEWVFGGQSGDTVALANFHSKITSNQGSFLLRGGEGAGGVDVMHQLAQSKTIDEIRAVIKNIIFNQTSDIFGDLAPR